MAKISACIISFNEEKKIEDCLKSLQHIVDEIIVVDSFSTDATLEIARKYTDKITQHKFLGYGKQKNLALDKASYDWVLSLDCDERLSTELQNAILAIKDRMDINNIYSMSRKTFYIYRWLNHCWYPDRKVRLFNKTRTCWFDNNVHESIDSKDMHTEVLHGDILHYSFDSISDHLKTIDKFTEIGAEDLVRKNRSINSFSPVSHATWTFIKLYFLKRGFMDGFAGLVVAKLSYVHVFVKYSKAIIKQKQARLK